MVDGEKHGNLCETYLWSDGHGQDYLSLDNQGQVEINDLDPALWSTVQRENILGMPCEGYESLPQAAAINVERGGESLVISACSCVDGVLAEYNPEDALEWDDISVNIAALGGVMASGMEDTILCVESGNAGVRKGRRMALCDVDESNNWMWTTYFNAWSTCTQVHWRNTASVNIVSGGLTRCQSCGGSFSFAHMQWKLSSGSGPTSKQGNVFGCTGEDDVLYNVSGPGTIQLAEKHSDHAISSLCDSYQSGYDLVIMSTSTFPCDIYVDPLLAWYITSTWSRNVCD